MIKDGFVGLSSVNAVDVMLEAVAEASVVESEEKIEEEAIDCPEFDETKYALRQICKRGHEWGKTGKSLIYRKNNTCIECAKSTKKRRDKEYKEAERSNLPWFDPEKFVLGKPCDFGHVFGDSGKTLRLKGSYRCPQCLEEDNYRKDPTKPRRLPKLPPVYKSDFSVNDCPDFDENKYYLGNLCLENHEWGSTKRTLRAIGNSQCGKCFGPKISARAKPKVEIEPGKYLGSLCQRGHRYNDSEESLRFLSNGGCVECHSEKQKSDEQKQKNKERYNKVKDDEEFKKNNRSKVRKWSQENPEKAKAGKDRHRKKNRDRLVQKKRDRYAEKAPERASVALIREMEKQAQVEKFLKEIEALNTCYGIDTSKFSFGKLCKYKHDYESTGYSVRYIKNGKSCIECSSKKGEKRRKIRKEKYPEPYLGKLCPRFHDHTGLGQSLRDPVSGICLECKKELTIVKANNRRALEIAAIGSFTLEEIRKRLEQFDYRCAYCQQRFSRQKRMTAEHFIPLSKGGTNWITNILPCCKSCNSSRLNRDVYTWFKRKPFFDEKQWKFILKILGRTQDNYNQLSLL